MQFDFSSPYGRYFIFIVCVLLLLWLSGIYWVVTFCVCAIVTIWLNLGTRGKDEEFSAYSIFNKNQLRLPGQFHAGHVEQTLRGDIVSRNVTGTINREKIRRELEKQEKEDLQLALDQSVIEEEARRARKKKCFKARPTTSNGRSIVPNQGEDNVRIKSVKKRQIHYDNEVKTTRNKSTRKVDFDDL